MSKIRLLDCTLRDGGYINNWLFGSNNIKEILSRLVDANIDVIECGYLSQAWKEDKNSSRMASIEIANEVIPKYGSSDFVAMINFGDYAMEDIPACTGVGLTGLRIAFHKKDMEKALVYCAAIKEKGYKLYIQPMVSLNYSDEEFLNLIGKANEIDPYAFYMVDSFGAMRKEDLYRLMYLLDNNLSENIRIGFHSHNNLQLSYSHAQTVCQHGLSREVIIDASVLGMGRGAGNLNTELFAEYLNRDHDANYNIVPLLKIVDRVIAPIYQTKYWGYSLPYYLSASYNCHPSYAGYLDEKKTLAVENMDEIFSMIDGEQRSVFNKAYIRDLYETYQGKKRIFKGSDCLRKAFSGKEILILAPGKSVFLEQEKVSAAIAKGMPVVSVNFKPKNVKTDYIFVSNLRRWETLPKEDDAKIIVTSNIQKNTDGVLVVDYIELLNTEEYVNDNAGLMLIAFLIKQGARKIHIAGMDGYSPLAEDNYLDEGLVIPKRRDVILRQNAGMESVLERYSKQIPIEFVTTPRFVRPVLREKI
ncbi:MAG: aldolase catalytic domain-containing protein [Oscillospiraceae bacterium]|nr:aldolase catalytic domain-containing protein [Oscillospiraceae bacterium]